MLVGTGRAYPEQSVSSGPPPAPSITISNTGVLSPGTLTFFDPTAFMIFKADAVMALREWNVLSLTEKRGDVIQ